MGNTNEEAPPVKIEDVPANVDVVSQEQPGIADLLDDFGRGEDFGVKEGEIKQDEPVKKIEKEEAVEPKPVEEGIGPEEGKKEGGEEGEADETTSLREQLSHLSSILIQHGIDPGSVGQAVEQPVATAPVVQQEEPAVQPAAQQNQQMKLELTPLELSQEEFDGIFEKPENLIGILNKVRESAVEQVLRSVPTLAANIVNQQAVLKGMVQDFYATNKDLAGVKPFVAIVAQEISAKNPGWGVEQVFSEAAVESRKRLKMKQEAVEGNGEARRKPALPGGTGGAQRGSGTRNLSRLEKELADLM